MVQTLLQTPGIGLLGFAEADAYSRLFPFMNPVTLYRGQMERLLDHSDEIRAFIKANEAKLAVKVANGQTTEVVGGATTTIASNSSLASF